MAKPKILENISTIQNSGFTNRAKQAEVTSYKELGNGRWFGELTDAPESGVFFYNVFKGDNDNYKYVEAMSWINDKIFISKCINGEWSAWEDRKSVLESKINDLSESIDVNNISFEIIKNASYSKPYRALLLLTEEQLNEINLPNIGYRWWWFEFLPDDMTGSTYGNYRAKNYHTGDVFERKNGGEWNRIPTYQNSIVPKGNLTNDTDMNNIVEQGVYRIFGTTPKNFVAGQTNGYFSVLVYENEQYTVQEATCFVTGKIFRRLINSIGREPFINWYEIATTDKTEILLLNGWSVYVGKLQAIKTGNLVTVPNVRIKGGVTTKGTVLFNLPNGYRPPTTRHVIVIKSGTTPSLLSVSNNGDVAILYDDFPSQPEGAYNLEFSFCTE